MHVLMILMIMLLAGALGAQLWHRIDLLIDTTSFFCSFEEEQLLLEHLFSYGLALFVKEPKMRSILEDLGVYSCTLNPWPRDTGDYYGQIEIIRSSVTLFELKVSLYKEQRACGNKSALLLSDPVTKKVIVERR